MLTLQNFEQQISSSILQRGMQYYKQHAVVSLEETQENTWMAEVEGSDTYQVELTLNKKDEITFHSCDCPYDGAFCKHVVAVLYAVQAEKKKPQKVQQKRKTARNVFDHLLQSISLQEYQDFIRHFASKNKDFKTEFELYFADKDDRIDVGKKYGDLLQKMVRKHSDRGFIDYRATFGLSKEAGKLLATGHDFIRKQNYRDAFVLATVVLKEMFEVVQSCDDSAGNIGGTLAETVEIFDIIAKAEQAAPALKEEIFSFLQKTISNKKYFDFGDFGYDLFAVYQSLAIQLRKKEEFMKFADVLLQNFKGPYDSYGRDYVQISKVEFLAATGQTDAAAELVQQSMDIVQIRRHEVEKAIAAKDYAKAKKLINEGIEIAKSKNHPGTVSQWQEKLLRIAVLEKDTDTIRHYARLFAFDRGFSESYYKQWKATFPAYEWKALIDKLISENIRVITKKWQDMPKGFFKPAHPPLLSVLAPIYIQEGYLDKLLELVQKENDLDTALKYHQYLAPRYPSDLLKIYLPAFAAAGAAADNRSAYADLARKMKHVMKEMPGSREKIKEVARSLQKQFPRRPAMLDELNKIM